jgi:hypothetical protein
VHAVIGGNSSYKLDLNNDGIVDFTIFEINANSGLTPEMWVQPAAANSVMCPVCTFTVVWAAALNRGSEIGGGKYISFFPYRIPMVIGGSGPWANVSDRYLGLMFDIHGAQYFGWARLSVEYYGGDSGQRTWRARITGYAYETNPEMPIKAGQIKEDDEAEDLPDSLLPNQAEHIPTLGTLALGSHGLARWRREDRNETSLSN